MAVVTAVVLLVAGAGLLGLPVQPLGAGASALYVGWAVFRHDRARRRIRRQVQGEAWVQRACRDPREHAMGSPRLALRSPSRSDAPAFAASLDDLVRRRQGYGDSNVHAWVANFDWATSGAPPPGCPLWLGIYDPEHGGRFAGLYIVTLDAEGTTAELGWWIGQESRGRGIGRESLPLVVAYVHEHLGVATVRMGTSGDNEPALAQIRSAGGVVVGEEAHRLPNGRVVDGLWFEHRRPQASP